MPFQNKFHRFLDYFHSLSPPVGAESQSRVIRSLLARRLAYYNLMTEAQHTEQTQMKTLEKLYFVDVLHYL